MFCVRLPTFSDNHFSTQSKFEDEKQLSLPKTLLSDKYHFPSEALLNSQKKNHFCKEKAAVIIQKHVRRYLQLKKIQKTLLSRTLFPKYYPYCVSKPDPSKRVNLSGNTDVYAPEELPGLILKHSKNSSLFRLRVMHSVQSILSQQRASHLIVPRARICKDFLVEERLPIGENTFHHIEMYACLPQLFDEAVKEMTRLFSRITIPDLIGNRQNYRYIEGCRDVRYDNIPLYIVNKNGKPKGCIGLIDLGKVKDNPTPNAVKLLARLFPLHDTVIKEQALQHKLPLSCIDAEVAEGRKFLKTYYSDHLAFLESRGINPKRNAPFSLDPRIAEELAPVMESELFQMNGGKFSSWQKKDRVYSPPISFLRDPENQAQIIKLVEKATNLLVTNVSRLLNNSRLLTSSVGNNDLSEEVRLLTHRSPCVNKRHIWSGIPQALSSHVKSVEPDELADIADQWCDRFLEELVARKCLYYFAHDRHYDYCWIRF